MALKYELQPLAAVEYILEDEATRVILVGNTGSGKSTLGNILLQRDDVFPDEEVGATPARTNDPSTGFVVGTGFDPETTKCDCRENDNAWGKHMKVVDTPGIFDPGDKSIQEQLAEAASLVFPGPHAVLFVTRCDTRFPPEENAAFDTILHTFTEEVRKHLILVFTRGESLAGRPIEKFLERAPQSLKDVMTIVGDNYAVISRTDNPGVREREIQRLLRKIDDVSNYSKTYFVQNELQGYLDTAIAPQSDSPTTAQPVKETRVILFGKTGCGKSSLGNILLQKMDAKIRSDDPDVGFVVSGSFGSVTKTCEHKISENAWGRCMEVVDTPGLFDTSEDFSRTLKELTNVLALSYPGPHAILFVTRIDVRFTDEEYEAFVKVHEMFEDQNRFLILVFTRGDTLEGETIEDKIAGAPENLKKVLKIVGGKYAVISKTKNKARRKEEVETILAMVDSVSNGCKDYYTNKDLKEMMDIINEEIGRIMKEKNITWQEAEMLVKKEILEEKEKQFMGLRRKFEHLVMVTHIFASMMDINTAALWTEYLIRAAAVVQSQACSLTYPIKMSELIEFLKEKRKKRKRCCII